MPELSIEALRALVDEREREIATMSRDISALVETVKNKEAKVRTKQKLVAALGSNGILGAVYSVMEWVMNRVSLIAFVILVLIIISSGRVFFWYSENPLDHRQSALGVVYETDAEGPALGTLCEISVAPNPRGQCDVRINCGGWSHDERYVCGANISTAGCEEDEAECNAEYLVVGQEDKTVLPYFRYDELKRSVYMRYESRVATVIHLYKIEDE